MQDVHFAIAQGQWIGTRESTVALYTDLIAQAAATGAEIIGLPEFTLSPYFASVQDGANYVWAESLTHGPSAQFFNQQAQRHQVTLIGSIFERDDNGRYWDTATIHSPDGQLIHFTRKVHIPSGEGYHESYYFAGDDAYPVHQLSRLKLGAPTCYDQWFPELARIYALNGAEFLFYPSAIGSEPTAPDFDSSAAWQTVMRGHAVANGLFIAAANRTGTENNLTFYGSSFICDPLGRILAQASRNTTEIIHAKLESGVRHQYLALFPLLHQRRTDAYRRILDKFDQAEPPAWLAQSHERH